MRYFYFLCSFLVSLLATPSALSLDMEKTLYLVTHNYPPFSVCEGKEAQDSFIKEVVAAACKEAQMPCTLACFSNKRSKHLLKTGEAHGNYPLGWNAKRDQWLIWSPKLNSDEYGFYRHKDSQFQRIENYIGHTIGVFGPSNTLNSLKKIQKKLLDEKGKTFDISVQPTSTGASMKQLALKRVDGVFINKNRGQQQLEKFGLTNVEYGFAVKKLNFYVGFSKEKNTGQRKVLVDRFNQAIERLHENGEMKKIINHFQLSPYIEEVR